MVGAGLVSESSTFFIRVLRGSAAARETNAVLFQDRESVQRSGVAGPRESDWCRDVVFFAAIGDRTELLGEFGDVLIADAEMIASVIADLKAVSMQLSDLLPSHVVSLVVAKVKTFGDEERRTKFILQQNRSHDYVVALRRDVEGQHD